MKRIALITTVVAAAVGSIGSPIAQASVLDSPSRENVWTKEDRSAANFMVRLLRQKLADKNKLAWSSLYPPHQAIAPLELFVSCQGSIPMPGQLGGVRALRVVDEPVEITGGNEAVMTKAVIVKVTVWVVFWPFKIVEVRRLHTLRFETRWTWILSPEQYEGYSAGNCP